MFSARLATRRLLTGVALPFALAVGLVALSPGVALGRASSPARQAVTAGAVTPLGDWSATYSHCTSGWCDGQDFHNTTTITSYDAATGAFAGVDAGLPVHGELHGSSFTMTIGGGSGYTAVVHGTISGDTWKGTWTDSNKVGGTWDGTRASKEATLSVSVSTAGKSGAVGVGDSVAVQVKVTAGPVDLSGVDLGQGLVALSDLSAISKRPPGLSGFDLPAGASRTFTFTVQAKKAGAAGLRAAASASTPAGDTVRGAGSLTLQVGARALAISFETSPSRLELKVGSDGTVSPGKVTVKVTVTNASKATLSGVQLLTLSPEPVDLTQRLNPLAFPSGTLPVRFPGSFAPGAHASRTFTLTVTGDGAYHFRALALYNDPSRPGGNGRSLGIGGDFEAVVPLLYFTADLHRDAVADTVSSRDGVDWVKGGGVVRRRSDQEPQHLPVTLHLPGDRADRRERGHNGDAGRLPASSDRARPAARRAPETG